MENGKLKAGDIVRFLDGGGYTWIYSGTKPEKCYGIVRGIGEIFIAVDIYKKWNNAHTSISPLLKGRDWTFPRGSLEKITPNWFQRLRASKI